MKSHFFLLPLVLVLSFCSRSNIIEGVRLKAEKAGISVEAEADSCFLPEAPAIANYTDIQIVGDTLLILQKSGDVFYDVFDLKSGAFVTSFAHKGRASGEFISPSISHLSASESHLFVSDNSLGLSFSIDIGETEKKGRTVIANTSRLPDNTVDAIPVSDSSYFAVFTKDNQFLFTTFNQEGQLITEPKRYSKVADEIHAPFLSAILTSDRTNGRVAYAMVCFPQVLLIDSQGNPYTNIAVSDEYGNWRETLRLGFNPGTKQFFAGITSSDKYIFASLWGCPISEAMTGGHKTSVCLLNWEGKFLARIRLKEDIGQIAFDSRNNTLYGIDCTEGKVMRYDLSFLSL